MNESCQIHSRGLSLLLTQYQCAKAEADETYLDLRHLAALSLELQDLRVSGHSRGDAPLDT